MAKAAVLAFLALSASWTLVAATSTDSQPARPSSSRPAASAQEFIATHCTACHNDRARTAGLSLNIGVADIAAHPELWEKVLHKVQTRQMPPSGRPQPDSASRTSFVSWLARSLDAASLAVPPARRAAVHRLNRTEYANAIRDLFGLEVDARALLLPDEADEGFDNVAASLALSPAHLERYLSAAREISRLAVGSRGSGDAPASATYKVPKLLEQDVRISDDAPFGSRGGVAVRHHFPADGEYVFKVRLRRQVYDYIVGMGHAQQLDIRVDGVRVKRFTVGGEAPGTPGPLTWNGEIVGDTEWELYMHAADAALEVRAPVRAGTRVVSASFVDSPWEPEGVTQPLPVDFGRGSDEQYDGYAAVDALSVQGPYAARGAGTTLPRRTIFMCTPATTAEERPCASRILTALARRAYRRPPTAGEVTTLLGFFDASRKERGFDAGIQSAIERMLVSFNFLFRIEGSPQFDLASRLSFFLWSSIPDEELLDLAAKGRLTHAPTLAQQVQRLLRDARSRALIDSFAMQWLGVRKAASALPDPNVFPEFDENLRQAFLAETSLFLNDQLRADRSIVDLLTADYSFLNERLAQHYGVADVIGERFRKVSFADGTRGGLLGQGSVLLATSYPDRTTPVLRGVWVLDNLLGMPPPPPPPGIPDLEAKAADGRTLSIREQMEVHRRSPACSVCHVRMDPLGFSLENFDAIGRWRTHSDGQPVDATAVFADGTPIDGVRGLRAFLSQHRDNYVQAFVTKLLTYALGRRLDYRDQPVIRQIVRDAAAAEYRWSAIVMGIVQSRVFQARSGVGDQRTAAVR
jgi:hypothetical protein